MNHILPVDLVFENEIDIGFSNVEDMGHTSPDKAKSKYLKMKKEMLTVRNNWKRSGNGEGTLQRNKQNLGGSYVEEEEVLIDANDKRNFLGGNSPAILYLWKKAGEYDKKSKDYVDDEANEFKKLRSSIETANINELRKAIHQHDEKVFELTMKLEEASEGSAFARIISMRKEKLEQEISEMKEEMKVLKGRAQDKAKGIRDEV